MIILVTAVSVVLFLAAVCVCSKAGEKDGICKYGYEEEKR